MMKEQNDQIPLPEAFLGRMERLLGAEYEDFLGSLRQERSRGLRLNPLRLRDMPRDRDMLPEQGLPRDSDLLPEQELPRDRDMLPEQELLRDREEAREKLRRQFGLRRIGWCGDGYYYDPSACPGRHPYHEAGVYYIQEPSAMAAVELLDPRPGEKVLDLCAAPGGKATQIGGKMRGRGLLVANEIRSERARVLSQNIERMGIGNAVVINADPEKLPGYFPFFFDRVLVDAPCSGEGMFRKEESARQEWSPENVRFCAERQAKILDCAALMLRPGGRLVYSTCTFSPEENEGSIGGFLRRHPDFAVEKAEMYKGFSPGCPDWVLPRNRFPEENDRTALAGTVRIWPHRAEGEGHFIAVLRRKDMTAEISRGVREDTAELSHGVRKDAAELSHGVRKDMTAEISRGARGRDERERGNRGKRGREALPDRETLRLWETFCSETLNEDPADGGGQRVLFGEQLYLLPWQMPDFGGLRVLRPGLHLGTLKKNRIEPSHALAMYLDRSRVKRWYSVKAESGDAERYLRGETLKVPPFPPDACLTGGGWVHMEIDGFPIGWASRTGEILKNHYPKGLRR